MAFPNMMVGGNMPDPGQTPGPGGGPQGFLRRAQDFQAKYGSRLGQAGQAFQAAGRGDYGGAMQRGLGAFRSWLQARKQRPGAPQGAPPPAGATPGGAPTDQATTLPGAPTRPVMAPVEPRQAPDMMPGGNMPDPRGTALPKYDMNMLRQLGTRMNGGGFINNGFGG